jgi:hypothetical protein
LKSGLGICTRQFSDVDGWASHTISGANALKYGALFAGEAARACGSEYSSGDVDEFLTGRQVMVLWSGSLMVPEHLIHNMTVMSLPPPLLLLLLRLPQVPWS